MLPPFFTSLKKTLSFSSTSSGGGTGTITQSNNTNNKSTSNQNVNLLVRPRPVTMMALMSSKSKHDTSDEDSENEEEEDDEDSCTAKIVPIKQLIKPEDHRKLDINSRTKWTSHMFGSHGSHDLHPKLNDNNNSKKRTKFLSDMNLIESSSSTSREVELISKISSKIFHQDEEAAAVPQQKKPSSSYFKKLKLVPSMKRSRKTVKSETDLTASAYASDVPAGTSTSTTTSSNKRSLFSYVKKKLLGLSKNNKKI